MMSKKGDRAASRPLRKGLSRAEGSRKHLVEDFFSDLTRSWQERGRKMLYHLAAEQPLAYVRAMVKLALIEHAGSANLSEFDRQRYREGGIAALKGPGNFVVAPRQVDWLLSLRAAS
jgi:hypothetical protein